MNHSARLFLTALAATFASLAPAAADTEPPAFYRQMQAKATEVLEIQFQSVRLEPLGGDLAPGDNLSPQPFGQTIKATAKVLKVIKSATGLKAGQVIQIQYDSVPPPVGRVSPAPIPVFKEGAVRPAWLKALGGGNDVVYEPVAGAYSFAPVPDQIPVGVEGE